MILPASSSILRAENLSATFSNKSGKLTALKDINLSVEVQEFVCILGPSGSGKSTLLRILGGMLAPSSGSVALGGQPLRGPHPKVGIVFQDPNLMPWRTVIQNILLPLELQDTPKEAAQTQANQY